MDQNRMMVLIAVLVIAIIVIAAIAFVNSRKKRRLQLRERFGPEYERVLKQEGDPRKAEGVLEFRQKRREEVQNSSAVGSRPFELCGALERGAGAVCGRSAWCGDGGR